MEIGLIIFFTLLAIAVAPGAFILSWVVACRIASKLALKWYGKNKNHILKND